MVPSAQQELITNINIHHCEDTIFLSLLSAMTPVAQVRSGLAMTWEVLRRLAQAHLFVQGKSVHSRVTAERRVGQRGCGASDLKHRVCLSLRGFSDQVRGGACGRLLNFRLAGGDVVPGIARPRISLRGGLLSVETWVPGFTLCRTFSLMP